MTEQSLRQLKILYVEDDPTHMVLMREVLKSRPALRLMEAGSGSAAMIIAESERPDLILLDRNLPDMSGEDVMRVLRGRTATKDTPILIISGDTEQPLTAESPYDIAGYVVKPFEIGDLLSQIDQILSLCNR
jgi:DNA-binding response OmpR family regulator